MRGLRKLCIVTVLVPVLIICAAEAGPLGPPGMFYRTLFDENLGFSITIPVYWYAEAGSYPPDRSHIQAYDPLSHSVIAIDCLWTRNDAYPYFYRLETWPGNDTLGESAELSKESDGLLSIAGIRDYSGPISYYLYNETRYPGRGDSKFEYEASSFVPDPSPMRITNNALIVEQALGSIRIFDPAQKPENLTQLPLYPDMIGTAGLSGIPRAERDSNVSQTASDSPIF
jgi:hypothetical protein